MSTSFAVAINVVLDTAIVVAILAVLGWGMRAQVRDMRLQFVERRRESERRRSGRGIPAHGERRTERRRGQTVTA
jgi:hypothetical protein